MIVVAWACTSHKALEHSPYNRHNDDGAQIDHQSRNFSHSPHVLRPVFRREAQSAVQAVTHIVPV